MIYAIKLKESELYLQEDGSYKPNIPDAECFFDYSYAKSCVSENEEVVSVKDEGETESIG